MTGVTVMGNIELLAPAGDMERLKTAFYFGADAVYLGGPELQLRSDKVGFTMEELCEAVNYAHSLCRKIYVAVNSFANNSEIERIGDYARELYEIGVDAVIVSDLGVLAMIKKIAPDLEVHISTQFNCTNYAAAVMLHQMGAKRVVLAREMSLDEIAELRIKTPNTLELEAFVHGAMCMSYSGRCLISAYLNGRSGNRGDCTQPCRWQYHLVEQNRPNEFIPIEESEKGTAILSSYDLNCIGILDDIIAAGITSLKIEGRMKSPYYVATAVNAYRRALDKTADIDILKKELDCASHRPWSTGFYKGAMKSGDTGEGAYIQDCQFIGVVRGYDGRRILVEQRNRFAAGDELEVLSPNSLGKRFCVDKIYDNSGNELTDATTPMEIVRIDCPFNLTQGDMLRRRI